MKLKGQYSFHASHLLPTHEGKCANLHGHEYMCQVTITVPDSAQRANKDGMIIDFGHIKEVIDLYDHAFLYDQFTTDVVEKEITRLLRGSGKKVCEIAGATTAENVIRDLAIRIEGWMLYPREYSNFKIELELWETPKYSVCYTLTRGGVVE